MTLPGPTPVMSLRTSLVYTCGSWLRSGVCHRTHAGRRTGSGSGDRTLEPAGHAQPGLERKLQPRELVRDGGVGGMNRLRRGYLDLAPELEQYFVTGHREDVAGLMRTYGTRRTRIPATQYLSSIALLVSVIVALLVGALAGMVADAFELALGAAVVIGLATALTALAALVLTVVRQVNHTWNHYKP